MGVCTLNYPVSIPPFNIFFNKQQPKKKKKGCPYNTVPHKLFEISQFYTLLLLLLLLLLKSSLESWNIILKKNSRMYNSIYKNNHNNVY